MSIILHFNHPLLIPAERKEGSLALRYRFPEWLVVGHNVHLQTNIGIGPD
jgi:hypothetical protein